MVELSALKPVLTSLVIPPAGLLLAAFLGVVLAWKKYRAGLALAAVSLMLLWLLCCDGVAVWLARTALPQYAPLKVTELKAHKVQAIVVLGGGLQLDAPEYGEPQPSERTAARLRYGIELSRKTGLPLAFTGGTGWGADPDITATEASVAARVAQQDYGVKLRWAEDQSRDTAGNARLLAPLLKQDGVQRIALVTDAWHLPRAVAAFERNGMTVSPAPTGFVVPEGKRLYQWLPSARGLQASRSVLRECLARFVGRWITV